MWRRRVRSSSVCAAFAQRTRPSCTAKTCKTCRHVCTFLLRSSSPAREKESEHARAQPPCMRLMEGKGKRRAGRMVSYCIDIRCCNRKNTYSHPKSLQMHAVRAQREHSCSLMSVHACKNGDACLFVYVYYSPIVPSRCLASAPRTVHALEVLMVYLGYLAVINCCNL